MNAFFPFKYWISTIHELKTVARTTLYAITESLEIPVPPKTLGIKLNCWKRKYCYHEHSSFVCVAQQYENRWWYIQSIQRRVKKQGLIFQQAEENAVFVSSSVGGDRSQGCFIIDCDV